ncbi:MAG: hypothetical protein COU90_01090 [Candidatus Ryanbacteria bacterium CG10_big_fil_rev_8_21_14_0_10_43_42]|uniref:Uncharacterized protein n=1 Tax=Candidatus Ryanbacteria bacterium CG10_big_fil_rev_8_21_14_0_10_43_42 TaxID=1974864 RepID=A0A2M8KY77_9BACT|nr:MAG: hypothetical protein COU90_01090 [Candidatus Ryanbacteria bacterium CG10_big_fil_rev_8_21_14_0_10_43_42]
MNEKDFAEKVLNKIENEHIEPKPRWSFFVVHYMLWSAGIFAALLLSVAVTLIVFLVANNEWDVYPFLGIGVFSFILSTIPYIWIVMACVFLGVTVYNVRHTRNGYQYNTVPFAVIVLGIPVILGGVWFMVGIGDSVDDALAKHMSIYRYMPGVRHAKWDMPESGFLAGEIMSIADASASFMLKDFRGREWRVMFGDAGLAEGQSVEEYMRVRMIGRKTGEKEFTACVVHPWIIYGRARQFTGMDYGVRTVSERERVRVAECLSRGM